MSARYLDPTIQSDPLSRMAHVEFAIRNDSAETWRPAEGLCVGYQVFDADTGELVADGARVALERDLGPGESARLGMIFHLPAEDGRYQVLVSPLRENVCWYYERNCPFLLIEGATVDGALATALRWRVSTKSRLRRARLGRAAVRAFVYPVATIWRNRGLIRAMVRHDILGRYRGSFGGIFGTVINPLLLLLTYFFVLGVVLETRFGTDRSRSAFALYFLAGMLPWLAFSEAAGRSAQVLVEHPSFCRRNVAGEAGGLRPCERVLFDPAVLRVSAGRAWGPAAFARVAAARGRTTDLLHRRGQLVRCGPGRIRPRSGSAHRLAAHAVVLPDADLLPGVLAALTVCAAFRQQPHLCTGAELSRDPA